MHVLEAALLANLLSQRRRKRDTGEPMADRQPHLIRSRAAALATVAAVWAIAIVVGIAVAGPATERPRTAAEAAIE